MAYENVSYTRIFFSLCHVANAAPWIPCFPIKTLILHKTGRIEGMFGELHPRHVVQVALQYFIECVENKINEFAHVSDTSLGRRTIQCHNFTKHPCLSFIYLSMPRRSALLYCARYRISFILNTIWFLLCDLFSFVVFIKFLLNMHHFSHSYHLFYFVRQVVRIPCYIINDSYGRY